VLEQIKLIDDVPGDEPEAAPIIDFATKSVLRAAATIYECGINTGLKLGGVQRRKHMASCSAKFANNIAKLPRRENIDMSPSAWVHAALMAAAK